jgi:hypothetical protein
MDYDGSHCHLRACPRSLVEAQQLALTLTPNSEGQKIAQREISTELENAFDARRQRTMVSRSQVNLVKWSRLFVQAVCALLAIAMVHSDNRLSSAIAMGIFATGVAASILLIAAHDRPFTGEISVRPNHYCKSCRMPWQFLFHQWRETTRSKGNAASLKS